MGSTATSVGMIPKHQKSNYFLKQGLFNDLKSFSDLEKRIAILPTDKEHGDAFEVFAEAYLATHTIMQAKEVWPFDKIPAPVKRKFRLDTKKDMGVDGLLQTATGEHHAYQVKFRSGRPSLTWRELATFIGSSKKTDKGLVFTNCNAMPPNVEDMEEVYYVRGNDLDRLEPQDFQQILNWLKKTPKPKPRKEPREYQQEAIEAIEKSLKGRASKRATAVMACGTGKTLIALWVAQKLGYKKILVLVPSLALLSQTLHEWMKETSWENLSYLCVCSDPTVTKGADNWEVRQSDLDFPVGTDSQTVTEFLSKRTGGVKVVFSTYQSVKVVADGITSKAGFDLGIFDEAHKTAGREGTRFAFALDDSNLAIKRRLFLTATPRHYNVLHKDEEGESRLVYSMDDKKAYGPRVYELPFSKAAKQGIICGYKVLISVVTSEEVDEELLRRGEVLVKGDEVRARQVANQLALKRATEKHPVKKAFTFHTFVNSAASFTAEGGEGLHAHLPSFETFHVSGAMPTATREEKLHEFEAAKKAVMSNARCLTEGVNIPVVDMVAFMSPKKSRVDIVQATGRAMRKAGRKKKGYILIPLFLQKAKKESLEDALDRTDFSEVWDVLQAMAEQDESLAEIIQQTVIQKSASGSKSYDDQKYREVVETLGPEVSLERLRKSITVRCIEKLSVGWDKMYGLLVAYLEEHRHCNVPYDVSYQDTRLGLWVTNQRRHYREGKLSLYRMKLLENIGFDWDYNQLEARWDDNYQKLVKYDEQHGHCDVPQNDPELGLWVAVQRNNYREGKISPDRIKLLEDVGFAWNSLEARWNNKYQQLIAYEDKHGHCNVPRDDPELGLWVGTQRQRYSKGTLSPEKIRLLEDIGIVWNTIEASWQEMYQQLVEYQEEHGNCYVPVNYSDLNAWVHHQRSNYRKGKIDPDKVELLEDIGFVWDPYEAQWEDNYQELVVFEQEHGHCSAPAGSRLGRWTVKQRERHKKGIINPNQSERLEAIGFPWDPVEAKKEEHWEMRYQQLVEYEKEHGNCNVNVKSSRLGAWVAKQRMLNRKGELRPEKVRRLEALGFTWERVETQEEERWENKYKQLVEYEKENGDCDVRQGTQLYKWVVNQRALYNQGGLSSDKVQRLDAIGFVWDDRRAQNWQKKYAQLEEFEKKHGHRNAPRDSKLGNWVNAQRTYYKAKKLSPQRIELLESLGFEWNPARRTAASVEATWQEMYRQLVEYEEEHGNCNVPAAGSKLGSWVVRQRQLYRRDRLSPDKINLLKEVGFSWNPARVEAHWQDMYQQLVDYKEEYGNCDVPAKFYYPGTNGKLGRWVSYQRIRRREGKLSQDQIKKLNKMRFIWEPRKRG